MQIGEWGHAAVILAFISALYGVYFLSITKDDTKLGEQNARRLNFLIFGIHALAVVAVVSVLFVIIYSHQFQYHYAWSHSSRNLPVYYMISCFWEGQEGSFLLWIFWHVVLGFFLLKADPRWHNTIWLVFFSVQAFLLSMLLGVRLPVLDWKIGSSPFILLREVQPDAPVFGINPNYIPEDGRGLNPLLQNYWMVIHPPTLFLGFALALIPFCYAIAALWTRQYTAWIKPAIAWTSLAAGVMGVGIAMGAYWAYETLNFGGYWNWDPVENAVYIPWLILVAGLHLLMLFQSRRVAIGSAFIAVLAAFILVLYATFLTRSGILGNASVHSFTDLGLSGQLMVYMLAYLLGSVVLLAIRWKELPHSKKEQELYSREFWISAGVLVLTLASFQVFATTSIPVYNAIGEAFGLQLNLAPPSDPIAHYTQWQMGFFALITVLTAIGQYFFWNKGQAKEVSKMLWTPLNLALLGSTLAVVLTHLDDWKLILLFVFSAFGLAANLIMLFRMFKSGPKLSGGALSHVGLALCLIGILYSAGYSKVVSVNTTGAVYRKDFSTEMNRDNVLMWRKMPQQMGKYTIEYKGPRLELRSGQYVPKELIVPIEEEGQGRVTDSLKLAERWLKPGDTVRYYPENTYYEIAYRDSLGKTFTLFPRAQVNPSMGLIASPDIRKFFGKDLYTHVTSIPSPDEEVKYDNPVPQVLHMGDTFFVKDHVAVLQKVQKPSTLVAEMLSGSDVAVEAVIHILGREGDVYKARPVFAIRNQQVGLIPDVVEDVGVRFALTDINPSEQTFTITMENAKTDWIIMKAMEKPGINLLWMGVVVMSVGFGFSVFRRFSEG